MNPNSDTAVAASEEDQGRVTALHEYQTALELGMPVNRHAFLARFPEVPDLAADLDALDLLHCAGDDPTEPDFMPAVAPTLADFELVREVGRGGMGVVFEARQKSLGRIVAVKILTQAAALDDRARRRFLHEAQAAALVDHANVVPVYHVGEEHGVPFYVMPLINGQSLANTIRTGHGALPPRGSTEFFVAVARIGAEAARALAAAHGQGVIHRDVKPANLLLDLTGKVWVTDFGLAVAPFADGLTRTGGRPGTPRYMSPEQLTGPRDRLDGRTDVYSLGVSLYELVSGGPAFESGEEVELLRRITLTSPTPLRRVSPTVPLDLETIVLKAMARDPDDRYATAQALADDLERFVGNRPVLARRPGLLRHARKWVRRNRGPVVVVAATLLIGLFIGLAASAANSRRAYEAERSARGEAEINRRLALAAVADLGAASDEILAHAPGLQDRQLKYLLQCRDTVKPFADDATLPIKLRRDIAWVHARLAEAQARAGLIDDALASNLELVARIEALVAIESDNWNLRKDAANANYQLSSFLASKGDLAGAQAAAAVASEHARAALDLRPDSAEAFELVAALRCRVADLDEQIAGPPGASLPTHLRTAEDYEELRRRYPTGHPRSYMRLGAHWIGIGMRYEQLGEYDAAELAYLTAIGHDDHLATVFRPKEPLDIRESTIFGRGMLGWLLARRGRLETGSAYLLQCVVDLEMYVQAYPSIVDQRRVLCSMTLQLAQTKRLLGRTTEAEALEHRMSALFGEVASGLALDARAITWSSLPASLRDRAVGEKLLADPKLPASLRAVVFFRLDRFADAENAADSTIRAAFVRAACQAKRGDLVGARSALAAAAARLAAEPLRDPELLLLQQEVSALASSK